MLNSIFSYFIAREDGSDDKRLGYMSWFVLQFPLEEFHREEAIFYDFISYCDRLSVPVKQKYLEVYLETDLRRFLLHSKEKIDGVETMSYDDPNSLETAIRTISEVMLAAYKEVAAEPCELEDFPVAVDRFMKKQLDDRTVEILGRSYDIISQSGNPGTAAAWAREQLSALSDIYDESSLEEITEGSISATPMEPLVDTGLPAIDDDLVALCRTQLLDISAPPGAGKTRMALGVFAHRAAVLKNRNVLYFTLEQSKAEAEAMLVSRHVAFLYSVVVTDKMILTDTVPKELIPKVEAARLDLFHNKDYGKLGIVEADLYLESFIDKIKTQDRVNGPYDIIIIDHMSLLQSNPPNMSVPWMITKSYPVGIGCSSAMCGRTGKAESASTNLTVRVSLPQKRTKKLMQQWGQAVSKLTVPLMSISQSPIRRQWPLKTNAGFLCQNHGHLKDSDLSF